MVKVENPDGSRTMWVGANEFDTTVDGQTRLWFHRDVEAGNNQYQDTERLLTRGVSETGYDKQGAYETIGDLVVDVAEVTLATREAV